MPLRVLATADLHIGRRPSRLPDDEAHRHSCARAWGAIVDRAVREAVDLVVLAGDVVDHGNRYFEATGPLERGLARLAGAGIPALAVAGNHDYDVLARVVEAIGPEHFRFLGQGGRWEEFLFTARDGRRLRVHGWSFPANTVTGSPLAAYDLPSGGDPVLGLLHADLDAADSRYAPVARSELAARDVTAWVLGHVHAWRYDPPQAGPAILYPGSPQAMDPGETGPHGPWLIDIDGPRACTARLLPLASVRYDWLSVELGDASSRDEFEARVNEAVRRHLDLLAAETDRPQRLVLRLDLAGATPLCAKIDAWTGELIDQFDRSAGGVSASIDKAVNNTRPKIDLAELAEKSDPTGVLAGLLLRLQSGEPGDPTDRLLAATQEKVLEVHRAGPYARIDGDEAPDFEAGRQLLIRQGMLLLETLRAQERTG